MNTQLKLRGIACLILLFFSYFSYSQCGCKFIIGLSATEWKFDGAAKGVKPGDKICFANGTRTGIELVNINGTAENPVIITNMCDGKVVLNSPINLGNCVLIRRSSFYHFTGSANPNEQYGIEIKGAQMGMNNLEFSTDFEVDHINVNNTGCVGIVAKTDPTCDPATQRGNFVMRNAIFHDLIISDTGCEGFYIGNSHYDTGKALTCNGVAVTVQEHDIDNVQVYRTRVINTGQDGIQVGSSKNTVIHHNYVFNSGFKSVYGHTNSIQIGTGSQAIVYNNTVDTGNGYGLFDVGGGGIWYNNLVMNVTMAGMLLQDTAPNWAPTGFRIFNNTFINCKKYAVEMFSEHTDPTLYYNNIIVSSTTTEINVKFNYAPKNKWTESNNIRTIDPAALKFVNIPGKDFHLTTGSSAIDAGKNLSAFSYLNFDLDEKTRPKGTGYDIGAYEFQPAGPTSNAGVDKSITLPTNSIILNGIGTSQTGITGYQWTKKTGGAATLTNATTPNLSLTGLVEGTYIFELQVTDASGFDFDQVTVNVLPATANQNPVANAGPDKIVTLPANTLTLNGIGTDADGTISSYTWSKVNGPSVTMTGDTTPNLGLSALVQGTYIFQLTVKDNKDATSSDQVTVTVNAAGVNQVPLVNAGTDRTLFLPTNQIKITATASDPDGTIAAILWEKKSGGAVTLTNTNTLSLDVAGLALGNYTFRITVTDEKGASSFADVIVKVLQANQSPAADAGVDQQLTLPTNFTTLAGVGSDPDGTISSYSWTKVNGPTATMVGTNVSSLSVSNLVQGTYVFGLTVTDNNGATGYDEVVIAVSVAPVGSNESPLALSGGNVSFSLPVNSTNLYGSGFDPDGTIVSYTWSKASGGSAILTNVNNPTLTVSNLAAGQYSFRLVVTDDKGATDDDVAIVTVSDVGTNVFPVASAGSGKIVRLPQNTVSLNGSGTDADGQIVKYEWIQLSGAAVVINSPSTPSTIISGLTEGDYAFRLTVTDNSGASDLDEVTVRVVSSSNNLPPVVNAGADASVFLPQTTYVFDASASDDGFISSYQWSKLSGPSVTLINPTEEDLTLKDLVQGEYTFQLLVTDNSGASVFDIVRISVLPATFIPPVVNAGTDQEITLPVNQVTLQGTATSPSGTISSTSWTKIIGPAALLAGDKTLTLQVTNMVEGTYVFKLTGIDNTGKEVSDNVQVVVKPVPPNQNPIVTVPSNTAVELPTSQVTLQGAASDSDGTISSVRWTQILGPSNATLQNQNSLAVTATNLIQGTYIFRLTATDNVGAIGFNEAIVAVSNPVSTENTPPVVYAGDDVFVTLPDNHVIIEGRVNDLEGAVSDIVWEQISGEPANFTVKNGTVLDVEDLTLGIYEFKLSARDADFLTASDNVKVSVIEKNQEIPKFFSPNNDGIGEFWVFRNIDSYQQCKVSVFSRSGQVVFEAAPYKNDWNGTYNGKPLADGDFYYNIKCGDGRVETGALRIIR